MRMALESVVARGGGKKVYIEYEDGASEGNPALKSEDMSLDQLGVITMKVDGQEVNIGKIPIFTAIGDKGIIPQGQDIVPKFNLWSQQYDDSTRVRTSDSRYVSEDILQGV